MTEEEILQGASIIAHKVADDNVNDLICNIDLFEK